jgi:hypothetical protein
VYKKCPSLARYLFDIFEIVRRQKNIPLDWRVSDGIMIPKVDKPSPHEIGDFRQIALLNVEGKLYWALVAERLYKYLVIDNEYVSRSVQKGLMKKVAGCWEHTAMVWSALKDAREAKKDLSLLWLDLANAYGSVPHKLIEFALKRYLVPPDWIKMIMACFNGMWGRTSSSRASSDWMQYERGIFAGCTISVVLFVAAFNVLLEYVSAGQSTRYVMEKGGPIELPALTYSNRTLKAATNRTTEIVHPAKIPLSYCIQSEEAREEEVLPHMPLKQAMIILIQSGGTRYRFKANSISL